MLALARRVEVVEVEIELALRRNWETRAFVEEGKVEVENKQERFAQREPAPA